MFKIVTFFKKNILYIALIQSLVATIGSIYFSEVKHFSPCSLCWYQRILMYPLVIIIVVGILRKDKGVYHYALPLGIIGWLIAFYQTLLQAGMLSEAIVPCSLGVSCVTKYTNYFGFISIPMLSLFSFSVIIISMLIYRQLAKTTNFEKDKQK